MENLLELLTKTEQSSSLMLKGGKLTHFWVNTPLYNCFPNSMNVEPKNRISMKA